VYNRRKQKEEESHKRKEVKGNFQLLKRETKRGQQANESSSKK
jgi:hypothetical protein